jgi:putative transposase
MKAGKYREDHIVRILKEGEAGIKIGDLCRKYGFSEATYCNWKAKYDGMGVSEIKQQRQLEDENRRLKQIVVDNGPEFISNAVDAWAYARGQIAIHTARETGR